MDNESVNMNDSFQMQQLIIFLKAELAKYKNEVAKHQESDYYSLVVRLDEENNQLITKNKELSNEILTLKKEIEMLIIEQNHITESQEVERLKLVASIESLLKEKEELKLLNKQLSKEVNAVKDELETIIRNTYEHREANFKESFNNLDQKIIAFTEESNKQMNMVLENLMKVYDEINESNEIKNFFTKQVEEKNEEIEKLQNEISNMMQQKEETVVSESTTFNGKYAKNTQLLAYLDLQMKKMLEQSIDFEEQLDVKLKILNELDEKLNQLTEEIEGERN